MEAKKFLRQIEKLDRIIENKMIEKAQWESIAEGTTANSENERVQSSGSQQKMADAVNKYVDIEREIAEAVEKRQDIIKTIERLSANEYDLLHKVYVQHCTIKETIRLMHKSKSAFDRLHRKALNNVQTILDERNKVIKVEVNKL